MTGSGHPVTVWGFLVIHHAERFALVAAFEEFDGNNIRSISFFYDMFSVFPEIRIVIVTLLMLAAKDTPMVETLRFADEVPFADHGSLVSGLLKKFGECLLIAVECTCIIGKTIEMAEFARQDTSS